MAAWRRQATGTTVHEVPGRIQRAHTDGVLEHVLHRLMHALRRLQIAALLDAVQTSDHLGRQDRLHGQRTDPREDVQTQVAQIRYRVARILLENPAAICSRLGHDQVSAHARCGARS